MTSLLNERMLKIAFKNLDLKPSALKSLIQSNEERSLPVSRNRRAKIKKLKILFFFNKIHISSMPRPFITVKAVTKIKISCGGHEYMFPFDVFKQPNLFCPRLKLLL
jgi:hypothetical protein